MIKHFIILFVALISLNIAAQEGSTVSPYSFYGIGELKFRGTTENKSMGGLSVYSDSIHLNLQNPASLGKLKLTTFTIGGNQRFTDLTTDTDSAKGSTTAIDYLAVGLPMGKLAMSFGLMPYSSVGYKTGFSNPFTAEAGEGRYEGTGGLNRAFIAGGYSVSDNLSFGANLNYNFGKIEQTSYTIVGADIDPYGVMEENVSELSGLAINLGVLYNKTLSNNLRLHTSLTYSPVANLSSVNERSFSTVKWNVNQNPIPRDTEEQNVEDTDFKLPSKISIGAGLSRSKKWFVGFDFSSLTTSKIGHRTFNNPDVDYKNSTKIALGGFYIPKYNSLTNYLDKIVYRAGVRFENTGLVVKNEDINEFGISFGVGLPVGRTFSNVNIGLEYGTRGTTSTDLVKEEFFNLNISLSLNDKWFQKRKID